MTTLNTLVRRCLFLWVLALPLPAYSQLTLTGAAWYATYSDGGTDVNQAYAMGFSNTLPDDQWWDLWFALNPDATAPINGPSDTQAPISIPMEAGRHYKYYFFSNCCLGVDTGFSLFFNGSVNPGISVYGALGKPGFIADGASILSLQGNPVTGAGSSFYTSADTLVILSEFTATPVGTPPGNVCQDLSFTPASDAGSCAYGSITLDVHRAASLTSSEASGSPLSEVPLAGSGFQAGEIVTITAARLGFQSLGSVVADGTGSFSTTVRLPQYSYGSLDCFASGQSSDAVGAAVLSVTSAVGASPRSVAPGGAVGIYGLGFGPKELVDVYLDAPRQWIGTVTANAAGSFIGPESLQVTVPANAATGLNGLLGIGQTTSAIGIGRIVVQ